MQIQIKPIDHINFLIKADDVTRSLICRKFTFKSPNCHFDKRYQSGVWNGTICFLSGTNFFPLGLYDDLMEVLNKPFHQIKFGQLNLEFLGCTKKEFEDHFAHPQITPGIRGLINEKFINDYVIKNEYSIRDYQYEAVESGIDEGRATYQLATASGKSLIIYTMSVLYNLDNKDKLPIYVVVPNLSLLGQTADDFNIYADTPNWVNQVGDGQKNIESGINICTWQTLSSMIKRKQMDNKCKAIFLDECHGAKSDNEIRKTLNHFHNTGIRHGFTGTLPTNPLEKFTVISSFGVNKIYYLAKYFIERGFLSEAKFNKINLHHKQDSVKYIQDAEDPDDNTTYQDAKKAIFQKPFRLEIIVTLMNMLLEKGRKICFLTETNDNELYFFKDFIQGLIPDKQVILYHSGLSKDERNELRKEIDARPDGCVILSNFALFTVGINIPSLNVYMLGSSTKALTRVIQGIGRILRKDGSTALVYDFVDLNVPFGLSHSLVRDDLYKEHYGDDLNIKEIDLFE